MCKMNKLGRSVYQLSKCRFYKQKTYLNQTRGWSKIVDESLKGVVKTQIPIGFKCSCGCNVCHQQLESNKKLAKFLQGEIKKEIEGQNTNYIPAFEGFKLENKKTEVILTKNFHTEIITVRVNISRSEEKDDDDYDNESDELHTSTFTIIEKLRKYNFNVEIQKGTRSLVFSCSLNNFSNSEQSKYDLQYGITSVGMFEGKCKESMYLLTEGTGLDGYLHELLIYMLEERGVTSQFLAKVDEYCTIYEHVLYIDILEKLKNFVSEPYT